MAVLDVFSIFSLYCLLSVMCPSKENHIFIYYYDLMILFLF